MGSYQPTLHLSRNIQRRPPGRPWPHDIPSGPAPRRRSPSPGPSRRYDSYVPARTAPPHREDYPNVYRPNSWRPNYSPSRSPSPDRYDHVSYNSDPWDRTSTWPTLTSVSRSGRRSPPSPVPLSRERIHRDTMATPMFEPSDTWKQSHSDRPGRTEMLLPTADRFQERRARRSRERSLERSFVRGPYSPSFPGGDRYRPSEPGCSAREPFRPQRVADCYRPKYDADRDSVRPRDRGSSTERSKHESTSGTAADRSPRDSGGKRSSRGRTLSESTSPLRRARSPPTSPLRSVSNRETSVRLPLYSKSDRATTADNVNGEASTAQHPDKSSRSSSRSSIASSRPSYVNSLPSSPLPVDAILPVHPQTQPTEPSVLPDKERDMPPNQGTPHSPNHDTSIVPRVEIDNKIGISKADQMYIPPSSPSPMAQEQSDVGKRDTSQPKSITSLEAETTSHTSSAEQQTQAFSKSPRIIPLQSVTDPQTIDSVDTLQLSPADEPIRQIEIIEIDEPPPTNSLPEESISTMAVNVVQTANEQSTERKKQEIDLVFDDIPSMTAAKSLKDALRVVVMTRLLCDRQTQEERVEPVLMANLAIADEHPTTPASHINEQTNDSSFSDWKGSAVGRHLATRFSEREAARDAKIRRLREEYLALHEQWLAHCARLDSIVKVATIEEPMTPNPGRSTRRNATSLGDAVRSDLEMEQIIASLGNDDLTDPNHLAIRNLAVIPDMISVVHGDVDYAFDDTNHLVHSPIEFYGPDTGIHDWTDEEKQIFLDKFAAYPKQFGIIAEFLPNKTTSQCVDYYYLHKKSFIDFRKVVSQLAPKKRRRGTRRDKQKGNGLLADIRQHDDEVHRTPVLNGPVTRRMRVQMEGTPTTTPTPEPEMRQKRRRTITTTRPNTAGEVDEDPAEQEPRPAKRGRKSRKPKQTTNPTASEACGKPAEQNESISRRKPPAVNLQWSDEDKNLFLSLLSQHGDDFKRIAASMPNKTTIQVSNYYKSNLVDLELEKVAAGAPKRSPTPEQAQESWKEPSRYSGSGVMLTMTNVPSPSSVVPQSQSHVGPDELREAYWAMFHPPDSLSPGLGILPGGDVQNTSNVRANIPESPQPGDLTANIRQHATLPNQFSHSEQPFTEDTACQPSNSTHNEPTSLATASTFPALSPASPTCSLPEHKGMMSPKIRTYQYPQIAGHVVGEHQPASVLLPEHTAFSGTP